MGKIIEMKKLIKSVMRRGSASPTKQTNESSKFDEEVAFWEDEIKLYQKWYNGEIKEHYGHKPPKASDKVKANNLKDSAILTWFNVHQKPKYAADLKIAKSAFKGKKVLDIGAGPMPSALVFEGCDVYSLDPLYGKYLAAGYPIHYYNRTKFVNAYSEDIPLADSSIDAVISVNAIDHVDDIAKTAAEIKRVLKPGGKFAMHVHYHAKTPTEPLELNDKVFKQHFGWVKNLKKVDTAVKKYGSVAMPGEEFALWKNF